MVYAPHVRLTAGGFLGTAIPAPEEWSCTLNIDSETFNLGQTAVDNIYDLWATFLTGGYTTKAASLEYVKSSWVDATGHVVGAVLRHDESTRPTTTSPQHPYQVSIVASLRTGERGASKRGRIYLPSPAIAVDEDDGLISDVDRDFYQANVATLLNGINSEAAGAGPLVVASSKGYNTVITGVNVGRALDTQRRRRRSLNENFDPVTPIT